MSMKPDDKELLKNEINKYIRKENYDRNGVRSASIRLVSDVVTEFEDKRQGIRLLLNNSYGLLGNLLFKYVRDRDPEISMHIKNIEGRLINEAYEKYGEQFLKKIGSWHMLKVLLKTNTGLIEHIDWVLVDPDLAYEIAEYCPGIMKNVVARIRRDREFTRRIVNINPNCLEYAFWSYRADREIACEAVQKNPEAIRFTDVSLRSDRELIMETVRHRGLLLSFADEILKDDREIVLAAVSNNWLAIRFASDRLQTDLEIRNIAEEKRREMGWHR